MHSTPYAAQTPTRVTNPVMAQSFSEVRGTRPEEDSRVVTLVVEKPRYWQKAAKYVQASTNPMTRAQIAKPAVMAHFGQAFAQTHQSAQKLLFPQTTLKTHIEAFDRWNDIQNDKRLARLSPIEPAEALVAVEELGKKCWSSTRERIFCDYNLYPSAIRFQHNGTITASPDNAATGFHAWFEPLARIDYTAGGSLISLEEMLKSYRVHRTDLEDRYKETWPLDLVRCRTLMDLLYVAYHLPKAYPPKGQRAALVDRESMQSLNDILGRFNNDYAALKLQGDLKAAVRVHKPIEQKTL